MRALILQFEADVPPEHLGECLHAHQVGCDVVRMDHPHATLSLEGYDMLVALGGTMNADQTDMFPFLLEARTLCGRALAEAFPCLGICLGGQILARTLDAQVSRLGRPEVGVVDITLRAGDGDPLLEGMGSSMKTLQFHEDTFALPVGASLLASSESCPVQIARCGEYAYSLQFHPEVSLQTFDRWLDDAYQHISGDGDPASREQIREQVHSAADRIRADADMLFHNFVRLASARRTYDPGI